MANTNVVGLVFGVISFLIIIGIIIILLKILFQRTTDRTTYRLENVIEPPSKYLLLYFDSVYAYIWIVQLYIIIISFVSYAQLSANCKTSYPELGEYCSLNFEKDLECEAAREQRQELCKQHAECDMTQSGVYDDNWQCDGTECQCSASEVMFAIPMLMVVAFGVAFLFDIGKMVVIRLLFWEYLAMKATRTFWFAFVSDSMCLDCCTYCLAKRSHEAIIHFYFYKRAYFRCNCITITYNMVRYIIFFVSAFVMHQISNDLSVYKPDTVLVWYDFVPLFVLWIMNEFVVKLRYKLIAPYTKREHVLFLLANCMAVKIDDYNIVKLISKYMGPEELVDYRIAIEQADVELCYVDTQDAYNVFI